MSRQPVRWSPWVPWTVTLLLVVASLVLPQTRVNIAETEPFDVWVLSSVIVVQALTFSSVGLVILRSHPRHAIGWLFAGVGVFAGLYQFAERYQVYALVIRPGELPFGELAAWLQAWLYVPALAIIVGLLPQLFPTGRALSGRWVPGLWLAALAFVGVSLSDALRPGRIGQTVIENPIRVDPDVYRVIEVAAGALFVAAALVSFASLVARWRQAKSRERQQLKLFGFAAAMVPVFVSMNGLADVVGLDYRWIDRVVFVSATVAFLGLPVATAVSILRHRLYDIDLVINRTLVYGALTATLVATYLASVLLFRVSLEPLIGQSDLGVAASTLAVAGLFRPLRGRIQAVVDRRFYRSRYDAARTLAVFSDRLRHEVDLDALGRELRAVVGQTMQPEHVTLWLRESGRSA